MAQKGLFYHLWWWWWWWRWYFTVMFTIVYHEDGWRGGGGISSLAETVLSPSPPREQVTIRNFSKQPTLRSYNLLALKEGSPLLPLLALLQMSRLFKSEASLSGIHLTYHIHKTQCVQLITLRMLVSKTNSNVPVIIFSARRGRTISSSFITL
jgi:hypothetical protein